MRGTTWRTLSLSSLSTLYSARSAFVIAGVVLTAAAAAPARAAVFTVTPTDDTFVSSSSNTAPQGAVVNVIANNGTTATNIRWAYLRFNIGAALAANSATFADVTQIKLTARTTTTSALTEFVYGLPAANDTWLESTLTMDNDPNHTGSGVSSAFVTANAYNAAPLATFTAPAANGDNTMFDVASGPVFNYIGADSDKIVSFVIVADRNVGAGGIAWASKENTTALPFPTLTITTVPEPASVGLLVSAAAGLLIRRRRNASRAASFIS